MLYLKGLQRYSFFFILPQLFIFIPHYSFFSWRYSPNQPTDNLPIFPILSSETNCFATCYHCIFLPDTNKKQIVPQTKLSLSDDINSSFCAKNPSFPFFIFSFFRTHS